MSATSRPKAQLRKTRPISYDGSMAPLLRSRKYLECFYCGKKSNIQYDGFMTRWECRNCDSTNFLDQNGQITDPPVATDVPVSKNIQYAIPRPNSPPRLRNDESSLFCKTCLKNQHLFAASIAQYDVELDTRDPNYRQKEKDFFAYRRRLEKTYPQVCQDCEPKVQSRLREAGMTAKADHLRRMMDKSRARRSQKPATITSTGMAGVLGRTLWFLGLLGQISWNVCEIFSAGLEPYLAEVKIRNDILGRTIATIIGSCLSDVWIRSGIFCSILSLWWNPMFSQMRTGFVSHIAGFGDWYKFQVLMIISRLVFYYISGLEVLVHPNSPANTAAHIVMLIFILLLAYRAKQSLKVDLTPLWQSNQEKLVNVETTVQPQKSSQEPESLADILDSIVAAPTRHQTGNKDSSSRSVPALQTSSNTLDRSRPFALDESPIVTGLRSSYQSLSNSVSSQTLAQYTRGDEMDWEALPVPVSPPRAFRPLDSSENESRPFSHAPASENANPFWYKIPAAPKSQAEKIWNPPQEPKLYSYSPEVKENYFNSLTKKNLTLKSKTEENTRELKLQPPRFFAPSTKSEVGTSLANMLTSISLDTIPDDIDESMEVNTATWKFKWDHLGQFVVLLLGLWFWHHAFKHPDENSTRIFLGILSGCLALGARTLVNTFLFVQGGKSQLAQWAGIIAGVIECIAAVWGILEVTAGRANQDIFFSLGTILIAGMMIQEFWHASFGRGI